MEKVMRIMLLHQGFPKSENSVGNLLLESLSDIGFDKFFCTVAFVRQSGLAKLSYAIEEAKNHLKKVRIVVGVDQRGTSKEALEALLKLNVETSICHTISPVIFHPKIYFFEGKQRSRLIIGSSNLTQRGLFQNMEASLQVDIISDEESDKELLIQIHEYIDQFLEDKNDNVKELTPKLIEELVGELVFHESEMRKDDKESHQDYEQVNDKTKDTFPPIKVQRIPETIGRSTFIGTVRSILRNFPEGIRSNEIYPLMKKSYSLTEKQKGETHWNEQLFKQEIRANCNTFVENGEAEHTEDGKYRLLPEIPDTDQETEQNITAFIDDLRLELSDHYQKRRMMIVDAQVLFNKLHENQFSSADFRNILTNTNELTGALGEKGLGKFNITQLCQENNISKVTRSLMTLFDPNLKANERVNRLLTGDQHLIGGNIGFISTMLFLNNSTYYNICNKKLVKGIQTVNPKISNVVDGEAYLAFNWTVLGFKRRFGLRDEEVDNVLWNLSR
jgi:HKD family nuclease